MNKISIYYSMNILLVILPIITGSFITTHSRKYMYTPKVQESGDVDPIRFIIWKAGHPEVVECFSKDASSTKLK